MVLPGTTRHIRAARVQLLRNTPTSATRMPVSIPAAQTRTQPAFASTALAPLAVGHGIDIAAAVSSRASQQWAADSRRRVDPRGRRRCQAGGSHRVALCMVRSAPGHAAAASPAAEIGGTHINSTSAPCLLVRSLATVSAAACGAWLRACLKGRPSRPSADTALHAWAGSGRAVSPLP
eukprot:208384-Chlamydomonas_euryale.AAC.6